MLKLISAFVASVTLMSAAPSFAEGFREREVDGRLANQSYRIDRDRRMGELSRGEARRLHRADARILRQERRDEGRNGGYLTRHESRRLNREENRVNRRIARDRRW